jgi:hypothetical protein
MPHARKITKKSTQQAPIHPPKNEYNLIEGKQKHKAIQTSSRNGHNRWPLIKNNLNN